MPSLRRLASIFVPLVALVGCDHVTKIAAKSQLENGPPRELIRSVLELRYTENTDIGFSLLRWIPVHVRGPLLLVIPALAIVGLAVWVLRSRSTPLMRAAQVLILAGALGNYTDRVARGYVVDFIHLTHWPVFNAADIWLAAGMVLLVWISWRGRRPGLAPAGGGVGPGSG